jgi:hypothetical protein
MRMSGLTRDVGPRTPGGHTGRGVERRVRKTQGQRTLRRHSPTVRHRPITAATGLLTTRYLRTCARAMLCMLCYVPVWQLLDSKTSAGAKNVLLLLLLTHVGA